MRPGRIRLLVCACMMALCLFAGTDCRRSSETERAAPTTEPLWTLNLSAPIEHLDLAAREPMIVEHPDGTLFVGGFGAAFMSGKRSDEATLWKSRDGGATWERINVGTEADGAAGNSDVDLAVAGDGTVYFATLVYDGRRTREGRSVSASARTWA